MRSMKLEITGVIALILGIWAMVSCWWFVVEVLEGLGALALVVGGILAIAIGIRRRVRDERPSAQTQDG